MMTQGEMGRRQFLRLAGLGCGATFLAACKREVVVETLVEEVEKVVKETVVVEKEVEKVVKETVVVEKEVEKIVTATPVMQEVTVRFMIWGGAAEKAAWDARYKLFRDKYPNIRVAIVYPPGNYQEKLTAMIASGTAPDVFIPGSMRLDVPRGILLPLDAYMEADPDFDADDFLPGTLERGQYQGVQYCMPGGIGPQVVFWNVDYFEEAGLENPNDLHERGEWTLEK
ncbi:MAG: ABC transporter substrate-binding protein, partial [Anaerolineae bacterium]